MSGETPAVREALAVYASEAPETEGVPPGYRQTEVGVIPEDWELAALGSICVTSSGATPSRSMKDRYYSSGTIHWVKTMDLNNSYIYATEERVTLLALSETSLRIYPVGTVLIAMYGGFNQIGRTGLLEIPAAVNQAITAVQARDDRLHPDYLLATLNFRVEHWKRVASSSRKDPNITGGDIRAFQIAYPENTEQRAIAAALSDVDALIAALDKLINKKRAVKTAAMQQLLTGKQRLPGFSGEWELKRLGDVCQIISGGTPSTSVPAFWTGEIPWCTPTDITENNAKYLFGTNRTISEDGLKHSSAVLLPRGALLLCTRATVGEIKIAAAPVCTNQGFKSLVCGRDASNEFLYYKLVTLKNRLRELGVGSTFLEVSRKDVAALEIPLPKLEEQTAIAAVLSDMDAEIEALEARREKTRWIKQGMMQELLTGRTRLV